MPRLVVSAYVALSVGLLVALSIVNIFWMNAGPADGLTYLAAGERLNAGHSLYELSPGDRPVVINPPFWTVPLLSPPPIAVYWRPLALLPNELGLTLWWIGTMTAVAAVPLLYLRARPVLGATAILVFLLPIALELANGNVNGLLLFGVVACWLLARSGHDRAAGVVLAFMTSVKITPIVLVFWFLGQRRWQAVAAFGVTAVAIGVVTLLGAGLDNTLAYLDVVVDTSAIGTTQFSLAGLLRRIGVAPEIARFAPWTVVALGALTMLWRRDRPELAYTVGVFTMVWGSPVMNVDWLSIMLGALAPGIWAFGSRSDRVTSPS